MQKLSNLTLTILVLISSVLGLILVQRGVFALWQEPNNSPANTSLNSIVFTPLTQDINLNSYRLTDTNFSLEPGGSTLNNSAFSIRSQDPLSHSYNAGYFEGDLYVENSNNSAYLCLNDVSVGGGCIDAWTDITGGLGADLWQQNPSDLTEIYYNADFVGIGTTDPTMPLEVVSSQDVKIKMFEVDAAGTGRQNVFSTYGTGPASTNNDNNNVRLGQAAGSNPLYIPYFTVQTKYGVGATFTDKLTIESDTGEVGIGTATPNQLLHLYKTSGNNAEIDIQSTAAASSHWGIYHDRTTQDLRFWNGSIGASGGNLLTLTNGTTDAVKIDNSTHTSQICLNDDGVGTDCISSWLQSSLWKEGQFLDGPNTLRGNQVYYGVWYESLSPEIDQYWTEGGNVGIGTNNPLAGLHVKSNSVLLESRGPDITFWDISSSGDSDWRMASSVNLFELAPGTYNSGTGVFDVLGIDTETNRPGFFMDNNGSVGIGDGTPADGSNNITFKVRTDGSSDASIAIQSNNSNWKIYNSINSGNGIGANDLVFQKTDSGTSRVLTLQYSTPSTASNGVQIGSLNDTANSYVQLDVSQTAPPDAADCSSSRRGRMILGRVSNTDTLYICRQLTGAATYGWYAISLP